MAIAIPQEEKRLEELKAIREEFSAVVAGLVKIQQNLREIRIETAKNTADGRAALNMLRRADEVEADDPIMARDLRLMGNDCLTEVLRLFGEEGEALL